MKTLSKLLYLCVLLPLLSLVQLSYAQSMAGLATDPAASGVLLGGDYYPRDCYLNSRIASQNSDFATESMLEPCDLAISYVNMSKSNQAATHTNRGVIRLALGDIDSAFSDFAIGMNLLPEAAQIFVNRGNAFYYTGNYVMAIEDYSQSIELGYADFADVYLNLGKSYERLGNINLAERNYRQAIELSSNQAEAQGLLEGLLSDSEL
ncbi:MAG: tetratricopeptide repeat protein [Gammaproteobacteria bacterium]|nr:tetratricopeptide repeat protein [Gammaproteobacteria bacterium]